MRQRIPSTSLASLVLVLAASVSVLGCSSDDNDTINETDESSVDDSDTTDTDTDTDEDEDTPTATLDGIDFDNFLPGSISGDITEVDCTLSNGTETRCYQFDVIGEPLDHATGPYCPHHISDTAEDSGTWLDNGALIDLDGEFIASLPAYYGPDWVLYDETTGDVYVTDTPESCQAAAQLNPPQEYWYHCIECTIEDFGGAVARQYTIPIEPVPRDTIAELDNVFPGVSLNGVGLSFPADLEGIVATFNIAALDDCAGHVNNAESYHYHGAAGCGHEIAQSDGHASQIGYAIDGYAIYGMTDLDGGEPTDLDECRGHTDDVRGYHYHAASPGENMFIGCFHGEVAVVDNGGPGGGPPRP